MGSNETDNDNIIANEHSSILLHDSVQDPYNDYFCSIRHSEYSSGDDEEEKNNQDNQSLSNKKQGTVNTTKIKSTMEEVIVSPTLKKKKVHFNVQSKESIPMNGKINKKKDLQVIDEQAEK
jgi:hypothetical protein